MEKKLMKQKKKILFSLIVVVLLIGCGRLKAEPTEGKSSGLSEWIEKCESENKFIKTADSRDISEIYRKLDIPLEDPNALYKPHPDYFEWEDLVISEDEEKKKSYTITWMDRIYCDLKQKLTPEDWETFQIYWPVLQGKTDFYYTATMDYEKAVERTSEDGRVSIAYPVMEKMTINEYYEEQQNWWYAYEWINCVSLTDMDGNGEKEFIIRTVYDGRTLVLHREKGKIYGSDFWAKGFETLQKNGLYMSYGGIGYSSYRRLVFQEGMFVEEELAKRSGFEFYIDGQEASEAEIEEWENIHMNNEARWYEMKSRNMPIPSAYNQLEVFAKNYKKWMMGKGNNYSYCIYDFGQDERLELVITVYNRHNINNYFYQVDGEGIRELEQDYAGIEGKEFDICYKTTVAFYDKNTGMVYYESGNPENSSEMGDKGYFYIEDGKVKGSVNLEPVQWNNESDYASYDIILSNLIDSYKGGEH